MKTILYLYATREGHSRRIADRMAGGTVARGLGADVFDVTQLPKDFSLNRYSAVVVCASVHGGRHEKEMAEFVEDNLDQLHSMPTVFLSVSLSEASVEDEDAPPEIRHKAAAEVQRMIDDFLEDTGWQPTRIQGVAGALLYGRYNIFLRLLMRRAASAAGGDTDTSRNYEYTNWTGLDHIVADLAETLKNQPTGAEALVK